MVHRGEILKTAIERSGVSKTQVHLKLKVSRKSLYNYFERADLPLEILMDVGKIIHHSFGEEIPELRNVGQVAFDSESIEYHRTTVEELKNKYISLLEEHAGALKRIAELEAIIRRLQEGEE